MPWGYDYSDFTDAELLEKENQIKADHFRMVQVGNRFGSNSLLQEDQKALQAIIREKSEREQEKEKQRLEQEKSLNDMIEKQKQQLSSKLIKSTDIKEDKNLDVDLIGEYWGQAIARKGGNS